VLLGTDIPDVLPFNEFFEYYGPDYRLHITPSNMENLNTKEYLDFLRTKLLQQLDGLEAVPGVQINTGQGGKDVPKDTQYDSIKREESLHPDERMKDDGALLWGPPRQSITDFHGPFPPHCSRIPPHTHHCACRH